ncbi:MAG: Rrf2 family transcriptional regulator [bacterium]
MFKISTKSQYGLRAMIYLARCKKKICPLKDISKGEEISFDYLEKIISKLEKSGLVKAKKGSQGGYYLSKKPSRIKIGEIIYSLEGDKQLVKCISYGNLKKIVCSREKGCYAKLLWEKVHDSLKKTLNSITLADLIK